MVGDYNTAHEPIDLARPKTNTKSSGFLPEERAEITRWIDAGWVDVFRRQHPGQAVRKPMASVILNPRLGSPAANLSGL